MEKILGPTNFRKRVEIPFPLLWPGVWKETLRRSARLTIASKRGVLSCSSTSMGREPHHGSLFTIHSYNTGTVDCELLTVSELSGKYKGGDYLQSSYFLFRFPGECVWGGETVPYVFRHHNIAARHGSFWRWSCSSPQSKFFGGPP